MSPDFAAGGGEEITGETSCSDRSIIIELSNAEYRKSQSSLTKISTELFKTGVDVFEIIRKTDFLPAIKKGHESFLLLKEKIKF